MKKKNIIIGAVLLTAIMGTACTKENSETAIVAQTGHTEAAKLLTEVKTTQFFSDEKIADGDIEKILSAGVNAPSAMNTQPWHFTAVTDKDTASKLADAMSKMKPPAMDGKAPGMPPKMDGNVPAPPSGMDGAAPAPLPENASKPPSDKGGFSKAPNKAGIGDAPLTIVISCEEGSELSAGLAVQNMSAEAQLLGYGTKIMTAPTMALNTDEYKTLLSIPEGQKIAAVLIVGKAATAEENPDAVTSATTRNPFDDMVTVIGE